MTDGPWVAGDYYVLASRADDLIAQARAKERERVREVIAGVRATYDGFGRTYHLRFYNAGWRDACDAIEAALREEAGDDA